MIGIDIEGVKLSIPIILEFLGVGRLTVQQLVIEY